MGPLQLAATPKIPSSGQSLCEVSGPASSSPILASFAEKLREVIPGFVKFVNLSIEEGELQLRICPTYSVRDERLPAFRERITQILEIDDASIRILPEGSMLLSDAATSLTVYPPLENLTEKAVVQSRKSPDILREEIEREIPHPIEIYDLSFYQLQLAEDKFDCIYLKAYVPPEKEDAFLLWKERFTERHEVRLLCDRFLDYSSMSRQLDRLRGDDTILTTEHLPKVKKALRDLRGRPPGEPVFPNSFPHLVDCTEVPMIAIDDARTQNREDVLSAERIVGTDLLKVMIGFIDVTWFVQPGNEYDDYVKRRGYTHYGNRTVIPTLGDAAYSAGSFQLGVPRPAWLVEVVLDQHGDVLEYDVKHALVKTHAHVDPQDFGRLLRQRILPKLNLDVLHEVTLRLRGVRPHPEGFLKFTGESTGSTIVGECMVLGKSLIARFLEDRNMSFLYKVHAAPTLVDKENFANLVNEADASITGNLGDPLERMKVEPRHFDTPGHFFDILTHLEERKNFSLLHQIIAAFLPQSTYSRTNKGHYSIGVPWYCEPKVRQGPALTVQYALAHLFDSHFPLLSQKELIRWERRANYYKRISSFQTFHLRFLETLEEKLGLVGQKFQGTIRLHQEHHSLVDIPFFRKWGTIDIDPSYYPPNSNIFVRLSGYDVNQKRFRFLAV